MTSKPEICSSTSRSDPSSFPGPNEVFRTSTVRDTGVVRLTCLSPGPVWVVDTEEGSDGHLFDGSQALFARLFGGVYNFQGKH